MADNVRKLFEDVVIAVDGGGEPPHNDPMEARVKALEEAVKNLPTKTDLDGLRQATKADMVELRLSSETEAAKLRADFEKARADTNKATGDIRAEFEKLRGDVAKGFGDIRADMHKNSVDIQRWMIATVIALFLGFSGLFFTMNNAIKPAATITQPAQQPIIINVPAASPASVATPEK
nr:hypothetical protein [Comamonas thiooxydans]